MGRRKLSVNEKKNELITIRATRKEKKIVKKLAKQNKISAELRPELCRYHG